MKRYLRFIALLLTVACLFTCLIACNTSDKNSSGNSNNGNSVNNNNNNSNNNSNDNTNDDTNTDFSGGDGEETEEEGAEVILPPMYESLTFGTEEEPYVYNALVRTGVEGASYNDMLVWGNNAYAAIDFWVDDATSQADAISAAVYRRNDQIESTFNCRIFQVAQTGDMTQQLKNRYMTDETLDLAIIMSKAAATAATQGLLKNLKADDMSILDLTHQAYDQKSIQELAMGEYLYYLSGDMNVSSLEVCGPTIVNLEMYEDYLDNFVEAFNDVAYADIYRLVKDKKWTIETLLTMAEVVNSDADQSGGILNSDQDIIGYFAYTGMGVYYYYGSGGRLTEIGEDGYPEFVFQQQKNVDLYDYLYGKFNQNGENSWIPRGYSGDRKTLFMDCGNVLFTEMSLFDVRKVLYEAEPFRYGVLPNPTYEAGSDYHSVVNFTNCNHLWAIPTKVNDLEVAQHMMNIFAAYSDVNVQGSTMFAYYERTLCFQTAGDSGSREVMNIIKDSMVYDIALLYDWSNLGTIMLGEITVMNDKSAHTANVKNVRYITKYNLTPTIEQFKNPSSVQ